MAGVTELKVDYDSVKDALDAFVNEVSAFTDSNETAFSGEIASMEAMNSDFVDAFARVLESVPHTIGSMILSEIELFRCYAEEAMENLQAADEAHNQERVDESNG